MGDLKVETDALLRDNNFGSDEFSDAVLKSIGWEDWTVASEGEELLASRRDFREEVTFTIDPNGTEELDDAVHAKNLPNGKVEIGLHVADIAHFVKPNSLVDREAKKRGTAVHLVNRLVNMLPRRVSTEICSLLPGQERLTVSVVFTANPETGVVDDDVWIGKGVIKSSGRLSYDEVDAVISGKSDVSVPGITANDIRALNVSSCSSLLHYLVLLMFMAIFRPLDRNSGKQDSVIVFRTCHLCVCCPNWMTRMCLLRTTFSMPPRPTSLWRS